MPKAIASTREFLRTGSLGAIRNGLTMDEVKRVLGSPRHTTNPHGEGPDTYWLYNYLEVNFDFDPPNRVNWFQIEHANQLGGEFADVTNSFSIALEGFHGATKPSAFLTERLWAPDQAIINIGPFHDDILLSICAGAISIIFQVETSFIPDQDAERYFSTNEIEQIVREIDGRTILDSIYSHSTADDAIRTTTGKHQSKLSSQRYISAILS